MPRFYTLQQDTRLTEWRKSHRVYRCDRCGAEKVYEGRMQGFDGTYLDHNWRGLRFCELQGAWERGEIDITWWRRNCMTGMLTDRPLCIGREDSESRPSKIRRRH